MSHPELNNLISPETRIFRKEDVEEYKAHSYQYAKSSHDGLAPSVIIYPTNLQEILNIVDYAKENRLGVAVRTGGHQFSGASSTSGENIQIDLSDTFEDLEKDFHYDEETNILTMGISFSLKQHYTMMTERGMFTPGGTCSNVHLGGHVQTGGYGMLMRSFGLLGDIVEGFDIVLADGEGLSQVDDIVHADRGGLSQVEKMVQRFDKDAIVNPGKSQEKKGSARHVSIWKPNSKFASADQLIAGNDDLFWAVMGGSPGNLGILTHVRIRPFHDKDYPDSRMMKFMTAYSPEKHQAVTTVVAEMSGDQDLPRNYNYAILVSGPGRPTFEGEKFFNLKEATGKKLNEDEEMMHNHGEQYADGVGQWAEKGQGSIYSLMEGRLPFTQTEAQLLIYLCWHNVNGPEEKFPDEARDWFEKLRAAVGEENIVDFPLFTTKEDIVKFNARTNDYAKVDYKMPIPISKHLLLFSYADVREFNQSVYKRTYISEKFDLLHNGYVDWLTNRIKEIDQFGRDNDYSVNVVLQEFNEGGNNSVYCRADPELSAHSFRKESVVSMVLDAFYDPHDEKAKEFARKWIEKNDFEAAREGGGGIISDFDHRRLWSTFGKTDDPDQGAIMDTVWEKYFDSREKYDRLIAIKRRFDPGYVFTANGLGVDATSAPYKQCLKINEK